MKRVALETGAAGLLALCASAVAQSERDLLPVYFDVYLIEGSPLYPFAVSHPCGKTVTLRSDRLPVDVPGFAFDWAYELSPDGKIKTRWAMPVDGQPLAVESDQLTIRQFSESELVFVTTTFHIGTTLDGPSRSVLDENKHPVECPINAETTKEIGDRVCAEFTDKATGKARTIAFALVCT